MSKTCIALSLSLRLTHWKQDLFLLDQSLEVREGDRVRGTVRVRRHKLWRRHLRVNLSYTHWREEQTLSQVGVVGIEWVNNYDTLLYSNTERHLPYGDNSYYNHHYLQI